MSSPQYVYVTQDLGKVYAGGREVLKGISLSFLPGAKIGVLGPNGAGKSTLLRIMAGDETEFSGEAWAAEGIRVGYLAQEPALDPDKTVLETVLEGMAETRTLLERFEEVSARFAEPLDDEEMAALITEQGEIQEKIEAVDGLGARSPRRYRHGRAPLPARRGEGRDHLGWRASARCALPPAARAPRHAASR